MTLKTVAVVPISRGGGRKAPSPARAAPPDQAAQRPAAPVRPHLTHRFRVGERLVMTSGSNRLARAGAVCKVISLLPYEGYGAPQYRVRSDTEQFERVVAEADLSRSLADR